MNTVFVLVLGSSVNCCNKPNVSQLPHQMQLVHGLNIACKYDIRVSDEASF